MPDSCEQDLLDREVVTVGFVDVLGVTDEADLHAWAWDVGELDLKRVQGVRVNTFNPTKHRSVNRSKTQVKVHRPCRRNACPWTGRSS